MRKWVKLYTEIIDDANFLRLSSDAKLTLPIMFAWAGKLDVDGLLAERTGPIRTDEFALKTGLTVDRQRAALRELVRSKFVETTKGGYQIRSWELYQPPMDKTATLRQHRYRAKRLGLRADEITFAEWTEIVERQEGKCAACGLATKDLTIDHIIPTSAGGPHTKENLQALCAPCNSGKNDSLPLRCNAVTTAEKRLAYREGEIEEEARSYRNGVRRPDIPLVDFGNLEPDVSAYVANTAAENKTGRITNSRVSAIRLGLFALLESMGRESFAHGLRAANSAGAPNPNYVKKAGRNANVTPFRPRDPNAGKHKHSDHGSKLDSLSTVIES